MAEKKDPQPSALMMPALGLGALGYAYWTGFLPGAYPAAWDPAASFVLAGVASLLTVQIVSETIKRVSKLSVMVRAETPQTTHGAARWATLKEIKRAGLLKPGHFFLGVWEGRALFYKNETHTLVLAPAGAGKTVCFVMNQLGLVSTPMIITDVKGELFWVTARWRQTYFGHRLVVVNAPPGSGFTGDSYNFCDIVVEALANAPKDALSDARGIALQLLPEPVHTDVNVHFRAGSRMIITLVIVGVALRAPQDCCLPTVQKIITDVPVFLELCNQLKNETALEGDVAALAESILACAERTPREFQAFLNGAVQVLEPFAPSGHLAGLCRTSTFRFREMRHGRMSVYNIMDPTRAKQSKAFTGLLNWAALLELQRNQAGSEVILMMDEATNYYVDGLIASLTLLRGFRVIIVFVCQEMAEVKRVYGAEAPTTIESQSGLVVSFGTKSIEWAERVSKRCGMRTVEANSTGLGTSIGDTLTESRSYTQQPLISPVQVMQMDPEDMIVFINGMKPLIVEKIGCNEIEPLRSGFDVNPMHNNKRFDGELKVRM